MAPVSITDLALGGAVVRTLKLGFKALGNALELNHSTNDSSVYEMEWDDLYSDIGILCDRIMLLKQAPSVGSIAETESLKTGTACWRVLGDLSVRVGRSRLPEIQSMAYSDRRTELQKIWPNENIVALEKRLMFLKDKLEHQMLPIYK